MASVVSMCIGRISSNWVPLCFDLTSDVRLVSLCLIVLHFNIVAKKDRLIESCRQAWMLRR